MEYQIFDGMDGHGVDGRGMDGRGVDGHGVDGHGVTLSKTGVVEMRMERR